MATAATIERPATTITIIGLGIPRLQPARIGSRTRCAAWVCGMDVDPHTAKHRTEHNGRPYSFCSAGCRTKFLTDPAKYLEPASPAPVPEGTIYTCPMHPEVRQVGPGACPICGMA